MADAKALRLKVDSLRSDIAALKAKRHTIETTPLSADEAGQRLAGLINQGSRRYCERMTYMVCAAPNSQPAPADLIPGTDEGLFDFLCAVTGDRMIEQISTIISEHCVEGLSKADREKRLAEIGGQLRKAERAEEKLISDAEAAGIHIMRRADADPAVILED